MAKKSKTQRAKASAARAARKEARQAEAAAEALKQAQGESADTEAPKKKLFGKTSQAADSAKDAKQSKAVEVAGWKQSEPEADARKSSFEEQLNAQLAELDAQIAAESDPKKKAKLEAEKATKEQWLNAIK